MADESALVVVDPEDSIDVLIGKIRGSGAHQVELLVPNGAVALQGQAGFDRLVRGLAADGVELLVFSADPLVLGAARQGRIDAVSIEGVAVLAPRVGTAGGFTPSESALDPEDAALLDALDNLPSARTQPLQDDYNDAFAALDELSATIDRQPSPSRSAATDRDAEFAAAFDDWGDTTSAAATAETHPLPTAAPPPRPRVRPEDIELSDEDMRRQPGGGRGSRSATRDTRQGAADRSAAVPRESSRLFLIVLLLLLLALLLGGWWLYRQRTTVSIAPPANPVAKTPVEGMVIPLSENTPAEGSDAVQARQLSFDVEVTGQGQATVRNPAPISSAKGLVSIRNKVSQQFVIPAGSDVVGVNAEGQEVHFSVDQDVVVPAAQTTVSNSDTGSSQQTTFGAAEIPITARAPGSASNLPAGAIRRVGEFGDSFNISSGPIEGGAEAEALVVGQEDVDALLGATVTNLYNRGIEGLQAGLAGGWSIERGTISPAADRLGAERLYEQSVVPDVGTTVDPANPNFSLVLRTRFSALATPSGRPLQDQISAAVANRLQTEGKLPAAAQATISGWAWDGQELRANADIVVSRDPSGLPVGFAQQLQRELVGKTAEEARALLEKYQSQGQIGGFTLPEREQLPNWSFLLNVAVASQGGAQQ